MKKSKDEVEYIEDGKSVVYDMNSIEIKLGDYIKNTNGILIHVSNAIYQTLAPFSEISSIKYNYLAVKAN